MIETISHRASHDEEISCLQEHYKLLADANPAALSEVVGVGQMILSPAHFRIDVAPDYRLISAAVERIYYELVAATNIRAIRECVGDTTQPTAIIYCTEEYLPSLFSSTTLMGGDVVWQIRVCQEMERPNSFYVALPPIEGTDMESIDLDFIVGRVDVITE